MQNFGACEYKPDLDNAVKEELDIAEIPVQTLPSFMNTEVKTRFLGHLNGWTFYRAWTYWIATADNDNAVLSKEEAIKLHRLSATFSETCVIRAHGLAGCTEEDIENWGKRSGSVVGTYHIDTQLGLCKFAKFLKERNININN